MSKCLLWLVLVGLVLPAQEQRIALLIGNGAYRSLLWPKLDYPVPEVKKVAAALKKCGFVIYRVLTDMPGQQIKDLLAGQFKQEVVAKAANVDSILDGLRSWNERTYSFVFFQVTPGCSCLCHNSTAICSINAPNRPGCCCKPDWSFCQDRANNNCRCFAGRSTKQNGRRHWR